MRDHFSRARAADSGKLPRESAVQDVSAFATDDLKVAHVLFHPDAARVCAALRTFDFAGSVLAYRADAGLVLLLKLVGKPLFLDVLGMVDFLATTIFLELAARHHVYLLELTYAPILKQEWQGSQVPK